MTLRTSKPILAGLTLGALALTLSACGSIEETNRKIENSLLRHGNWEQLHKPYQNRVEQVTIEHSVTFPEGRTSLTKDQRRDLIGFLQRSRVESYDRVTLFSGSATDQPLDPRTEARLEFVKIELGSFGIAHIDDRGSRDHQPPSEDEVVVVVDKQIVIAPDCNYGQPTPGERPVYEPGCANTANLGMMVADPNDLIVGRPIGPADGEYAAKSVYDYRTAEQKDTELDELITSTTGDQL